MSSMSEQGTTIHVSNETWKRLLMRKEPGDSFDDVLADALDELEELQHRVSELEEQLEDRPEE